MRVLFISSGNSKAGISPIIKQQGESLIKQGIQLEFFTIKGKGLWKYIHNIFILRKHIHSNKYDIFHAHYLLSGIVASLGGARPLVISLMGSDVMHNKLTIPLIQALNRIFKWKIIVKTAEMHDLLSIKNVSIIPNGVNIQKFFPFSGTDAKTQLGWDVDRKHVLFPAAKEREEKNFKLLDKALETLNNCDIILHTLEDIENEKVPMYFNASDVVVMTSLKEGGPNVIKEALACNIPVISVPVGDVKWLIEGVEGCFVCTYDAEDLAEKIESVLERVNPKRQFDGRERIKELSLDSESIADRIIKVYKDQLEPDKIVR